MDTWPKIVESFPLKVEEVWKQYTRIPIDATDILWHYTTHAGLKGIFTNGGLRATYRMRMNDTGEFGYARSVIYKVLDEISAIHGLSKVEHSLITYTRKNLDKFLNDTTEISTAYCACFTISSDHPEQWKTCAGNGKGFAIGFNMSQFLNSQVPKVGAGQPFILCVPVTYNENAQLDLVQRLVEAGIRDLLNFADTCSQQPQHLTALRDRITLTIVAHLFTLIDFIKAPAYSSEREMRLIVSPNDGTLRARNVQHYERDNESIPFIFMDLRNPNTRRLPLAEIKIGPKSSFLNERAFLEDLLDELGYGSNYRDRPLITQSLISMNAGF